MLDNTALHYAVKRRNKKAVQELLNSGADVNINHNFLSVEIRNNAGEEAITPIYEHLPETIISLLDGPNSIDVITGIGNNPREVYETYMLSNVFRLDKETRVSLFLNPVLQLFLDLKWQKMKYLIYLSMGFHISWSIFTSIYIMDVCMATYGNNTVQDFEFLENSKLTNRHFDSKNIWWSILLLVITGIVMLKEIFEFVATPKVGTYWRQFENKGQLALILSIYVLLIFCKFLPIWLDFIMSVMAVFTAWLLALGQLNKHPSLGLYMEMLMKVSKSFLKFFISFFPILISFSCVFRMLMPTMIQFYLWPPWGLVKIVTMLTGEINFDEIFEEDVDAVMVTKNIFILAFITIVAIVLQNLLVGLVVSDMQSLTKKARENSLKTQLEQMFLMEAFIIKILAALPNISLAVQSGSLSELENYLYDNAPDNILNSLMKKEEARCMMLVTVKVASELVTLLLNWYLRRKPEADNSFVDKKDNSGNTALHYAVQRRNRKAVHELLKCGADVNIKNNAGEEAITPIYELFPDTIITLLDGPNSIEFVEDEDEPSERDLKIKCNFSVITGIGNDSREVYETYMLSNVFRLDKDIYIMNVFMSTYENNTEEKFNESLKQSNVVNPHFNSANIGCSSSLLVLTTILALKEIFECRSTPKMGHTGDNGKIRGSGPSFCSFTCGHILHYPSRLAGLHHFYPWLLVLGQLNKHPSLGLYMEMLMKVSKSFMKFFLSFSPILIAFAFVFRMLLPSEEKFHLWPPWGIVKIVAMLTGEINFDETFEANVFVVMLAKNVLLLAFITIVAIVLQNLLIGLVVSDMQSLTEKAREKSLSTQLEQMFLMEAFIIQILAWFPNVRPIEELWRVTRSRAPSSLLPISVFKCVWRKVMRSQSENLISNSDEPHIVTKRMKDFNKQSRLRLRELRKKRNMPNEKKTN
ncbi:Transient receptor potential channel pyrexia [Orchesella cincta]|uniref:Transient receptor potential channel pyrexia n=1 Tax=Orchesella cincta TaxID=48709 RepID=A0A1D2M5F7_ORCCI|nr:Transient receptor potential channel pyrexia [Orchesella cincta]